MREPWLKLSLAIGLCLVGCGDDEEEAAKPCNPVTSEGCEDGHVCELVQDGEPACFAPLTVSGRVIDLADEGGVEGAHIVALDVNGAARSEVALSDADGAYAIRLPAERDADGKALGDPFTLHASAPGYATFPEPPRQSLPIDVDEAVVAEGTLGIESSATTIGLLTLDGSAGDGRIAGSIAHELGAGALVLAVVDDVAVSRTIADLDGAFTLFNVPAGDVSVEAYLAGLNIEPEAVSLGAGAAEEGVDLQASTEGLSTVSGSVNIVNAEGGLTTSVILALEATFNDDVKRGIAPAGLRAADVSGAFMIEGVAPGRYVALAAFENDELVRDPDEGIGGTEIVHLEIDGSEPEIALEQSFKVTQALEVTAPESSDELELVDPGSDPVFSWVDDSSEDGYEVRVYDAFGRMVHEALDVPRVSGGGDVTYTWAGAELEAGMIYQMRAWSFREDRAGGERSFISATEDLRGVFLAQAVTGEESEQ
jgi:hypothetical protein